MLVGFSARNHPQQNPQRNVDDRALPPSDFAPLAERFRFSIDVAASEHNAKLPRYYTREQNGLMQDWASERVYCNCPYSNIRPWVEKSWTSPNAELVVMLLPANRTEQKWWQELIEPYRDRPGSPLKTEFLPGRMRFIAPGRQSVSKNERPPFGMALAIWQWQSDSDLYPLIELPLFP